MGRRTFGQLWGIALCLAVSACEGARSGSRQAVVEDAGSPPLGDIREADADAGTPGGREDAGLKLPSDAGPVVEVDAGIVTPEVRPRLTVFADRAARAGGDAGWPVRLGALLRGTVAVPEASALSGALAWVDGGAPLGDECLVALGADEDASRTAQDVQADLSGLFAALSPRCRVFAATLPPSGADPRRSVLNAWLRARTELAGVVDFEAAAAMPEARDQFQPELGSGGTLTARGERLFAREAADIIEGFRPAPEPFRAEDEARVLALAKERYARTMGALSPSSSPKASLPDGGWTVVANTAPVAWTQGFFPGSLWLLYEATGEIRFREKADAWTRALEPQKTNAQTHDLGFKLMPSFGEAYRLTGDPYYRGVLLTAAATLASRWDEPGRFIVCCDWNPDWEKPLVVDTMMNLELLLWAADHAGEPSYRDIALRHALTTLSDLVRDDGSTFHVVDYKSSGGAVRAKETFQGDSDPSTWARGQAWAIYGYTMVYRYTRDPRMLDAARKVARYYLSRVPDDGVPNWDFSADRRMKDSSTAAAVASALLELSTYCDVTEAKVFHDAGAQVLRTLSSDHYLGVGGASPALLQHAVGHLPAGQEVDVGLVYGDYYFLEAVLRR